jgi:hypothetical protein
LTTTFFDNKTTEVKQIDKKFKIDNNDDDGPVHIYDGDGNDEDG